MATTDLSHPSPLAPAHARWQQLARRVRAYDPAVVVLVARKAPRVVQALELQLGHRPLQIADLGIALSKDRLVGARVAIIDDIINVGSTILRAQAAVVAAGASEVRIFALARREPSLIMRGLRDAEIIDTRPLDAIEMAAFSAEIPLLLQATARPYDLDFPLLRCRLRHTAEPFGTLQAALTDRYGPQAVYDLTVPAGASEGIRRLTVDLPDGETAHRKVRFFVNEHDGSCSIVPICLTSPLPTVAPPDGWQREMWDLLCGDLACGDEALARIRIFIDSLQLGLGFVRAERDLIVGEGPHLFDVDEALLILGPRATRAARIEVPVLPLDGARSTNHVARTVCSPFYDAACSSGFVDAVRNEIGLACDELTAFISLINTLADWVGATDPARYRFDWPYTRAEIDDDPYLRLRVGPTFGDLVGLIGDLAPGLPPGQRRGTISRLLDRYVDDGGVVPTTAIYEGRLYRIYRKGEKDPRDDVSLRMRRAWAHYDKPLSRTRAAKLATILSFSEDHGRSDVAVKTLPRGNVLCYAPSVLHDEVEITAHLLRTGQLQPVD